MKTESEKTLEYEKPTAVPLGEVIRGSGECTIGSAVIAAQACQAGLSVNLGIAIGFL